MTVLFGDSIKSFTEERKLHLDALNSAIQDLECSLNRECNIEHLKQLRDRLTVSLNNDLQLLNLR